MCTSVIIDGFRMMTGFIQRVTTPYNSLLHTQCPQSRLHSPLLGSGFQHRNFSYFRIPELSQATTTSFSQQQLTTEPKQFSKLNQLNCSIVLITSRLEPHRNHRFSVAVYGPLPSNDLCLVTCIAVVVQRRVYMPHYL
jgi:hypothetical protein